MFFIIEQMWNCEKRLHFQRDSIVFYHRKKSGAIQQMALFREFLFASHEGKWNIENWDQALLPYPLPTNTRWYWKVPLLLLL
jgi:hypothetical protein